MARVSVIIPAYNAQDYIDECLDSVCSQSFGDIEVIVVDDGSTDGTLDCVREHIANDSRIRVLTQSNQFAGVARNNGISNATGEYLYFLDADDWIESDAIESLVVAAEKTNSDIVVARSEGFDNQKGDAWLIEYALNGVPFDLVLNPSDYADHLFQFFMGWPWDKLYRTEFVLRNQLAFQPLRTTNDAYFVFCSLALADSVVCCDKILFHHRCNNSMSLEGTRDKSWHCALDAMKAIDERLQSLTLYPEFRKSFCNWVMNYSFWSISTLSAPVADEYLAGLDQAVSVMPIEADYYPGLHERLFREYFCKRRAQLLNEVVSAKEEADSLQSRLNAKESEVRDLQQKVSSLQDSLDSERQRVQEIYSSRSYELGNTVMKPLALARDAFKADK